MERHVRLGYLLDCYGPLLTPRQLSLLSQWVNEDLSLGEIAAQEGISRQGVRDAIRRAEEQLEDYEQRLGLMQRRMTALKELKALSAAIGGAGEEELRRMAARLMEICEDGV